MRDNQQGPPLTPKEHFAAALSGRESLAEAFAFTRTWPTWAHWALVVPAALGALILAYFVGLVTSLVFGAAAISQSASGLIGQIAATGFGSYWFVMFGASVAPDHKRYCALILAIVGAISAAVGAVIGLTTDRSYSPFPTWIKLVLCLAGVAGSIIALYRFQRRLEET